MDPRARSLAWELTARHLSPGRVALYRELGLDVVMGRREGSRFWDLDGGRSWIDCHTNGGVFALGHRYPAVVAAVEGALAEVDVGNHHLVSPGRGELARRLVETTDGAMPGVALGVSGGEMLDLAITLARGVTGRQEIVSAAGGYHGHTGLARAAGDPAFREAFGPNLPDFRQIPFDDLDALDAALSENTAAVLLEPIPATLGMPIPAPGYLAAVAALCRARGAKLILDEVQTGLGRTGRVWAHEHDDGVFADLLVTGKGLSGGLIPITALLLSPELFAFYAAHPFAHVSTFGGSELGCAAAIAVLDTIQEPGFLARVTALGERFDRGLAGLPLALRRRGLMMGLKLDRPGAGVDAARRLFAAGVFAPWAANDDSVLQLLPPLTLTDEEVDTVIAAICGSLG